MGKERSFYFLLIFVTISNGIKTQSELENVISSDEHIYDFQGCHCDNSFDSNPENAIRTEIEMLKNKIDKMDESILKLTQLTEVLLNNSFKEDQAIQKEFFKGEDLPGIGEVFQATEPALLVQQLGRNLKLNNEKTTNRALKENPKFDEHLNCIENCNVTPETPKSCGEVMSDEAKEDGIYLLHINGLQPFGAYCTRYVKSGWTLIQRRPDGAVNFYRNWSDYKHGFGNLSGGYWLGLERMHALTSLQSYELLIYWQSRDNIESYERYSEFYIGDEDDGYRLTARRYSGETVNSLYYYNGNKFSTYVEENDVSHDSKCVEQTKSAWWYGICNYSWRYASLNGEYRPITSQGEGIFWWDGMEYKSLKYVHMAIKPI